MTTAKTLYSKAAGETKSVVIDCAGSMAANESILNVNPATVSPSGELTVQGLVKNTVTLAKAGQRQIAAKEGLQLFLLGGVVGTVYTVTVTYDTTLDDVTENQADLVAAFKVKVI